MSEEPVPESRTESERRGITIGILVVALICLSIFLVWHFTGAADSDSRPAAASPP